MKLTRLALIAALALATAGCYEMSDGQRAGTITKFSHKGFLSKTWEGDLLLGGLVKNGNGQASANVWSFTVEDSALVPVLKAALENGTPVTLTYRQELLVAPWRGETDYIVTGAK